MAQTDKDLLTRFIDTMAYSADLKQSAWGAQMAKASKFYLNVFEEGNWLTMEKMGDTQELAPELFLPLGGNVLLMWQEQWDDNLETNFMHCFQRGDSVVCRRAVFDFEDDCFFYDADELQIKGLLMCLSDWFFTPATRSKNIPEIPYRLRELAKRAGTMLSLVNLAIQEGHLPQQNGHLQILQGGRS